MGEAILFYPTDEADDWTTSFACCLKQVRQRLAGKQAWLSHEVGCSDAAISFWESGARLPNHQNLCRILAAVARGGATTPELLSLRGAWHQVTARRSISRLESRPMTREPRTAVGSAPARIAECGLTQNHPENERMKRSM